MAPNGIEGLKEIKRDHVDLVVLDLMMPVAGGLESLKDSSQSNHSKTQ